MFASLPPQPEDRILQVGKLYAADSRPGKIDLGVGVYKNAQGVTPVMRAVKAAEERLWREQTTKTYTSLAGEPDYHAAMAGLIRGPDGPRDRLAAAATPGGTGAVHRALELAKMANPRATVWISDPTWPNHPGIIAHIGLPVRSYRYFDQTAGEVDFAGLTADLEQVEAGDVVLLHGCCHNPTGANPTPAQWETIAEILARRRALPLVDLAYQGFGDGLEEDAAATRLIAARVPEVLIAASCSKNFGIYRDRAGITLALTAEPGAKALAQGALAALNRVNYSFAPDHAARVVTTILTDAALCADWEAELAEVREGMIALRQALATALRAETNSDRFDFVGRHRGMFSRLGLTEAQVARLREETGIYMIGDSRINIAGLNTATVPVLARAVAAVLD